MTEITGLGAAAGPRVGVKQGEGRLQCWRLTAPSGLMPR